MLYGYIIKNRTFPIKAAKITCHGGYWRTRPTAGTLIAGINDFVPCAANHTSRTNYLLGVAKRNLPILPKINKHILKRFRNFIRLFLRNYLKPLIKIMSFEEWLAQTKYSEQRKAELRRANARLQPLLHELSVLRDQALSSGTVKGRLKRLLAIDSFIKREFYDNRDPEPDVDGIVDNEANLKTARIINSRSDMYKCLVGPLIASIEQVVFKLPWFVKHIPEEQRAAYITKMLGSDNPRIINGIPYVKNIYATDYTSFEASIGPDIAATCEQQLFKYMLCGDSRSGNLMDSYKWLQLQLCNTTTSFSGITVTSSSIRMSGEMNTSLGNGFTNLMLMMFMVHESGDDYNLLQGVFEGDDGLTAIYKPLDMSIITNLGFVCKLEIHKEAELASFCGRVYSPYDTTTVGDPIYYLAAAGWSTKCVHATDKTRRFLTMMKGISYCHAFAGSPVIPHLGRMLIRSANISLKEFLAWYSTTTLIDPYDRALRDLNIEIPFREPTYHSRVVCWKKFGLHPSVQVAIETKLDNSDGWVSIPLLHCIMPKIWFSNWLTSETPIVERLNHCEMDYLSGENFDIADFC